MVYKNIGYNYLDIDSGEYNNYFYLIIVYIVLLYLILVVLYIVFLL